MVCIIRSEPSAVPKRWVGVIPAMGASCQLPLAGRPVVEHVIERARPQVSSLILCPSGDPSVFARYGLPLVVPAIGDTSGLSAAILAGLDWAAANSKETAWVATFAAHVPIFPGDLVNRLGQAVGEQGADMAWAVLGRRPMPVFGLWPVRLRRALRRALHTQAALGVEEWTSRFRLARAEFSSETDPFIAAQGREQLTAMTE